MNKDLAISTFLEHVEKLVHLPLITDAEMESLFGSEVTEALEELDQFNDREQICSGCRKRCCTACGCELYAHQFSRCPVFNFRPVLCRLHFCNEFNIPGSSTAIELGDIFLESLLAAEKASSSRVRLFDSPPLARNTHEFIAITSPWVEAVKTGNLDPEEARQLIQQEIEKVIFTSRTDA